MKKYFIITFGCQMNIADSDRISSLLKDLKYKKTEDISNANIIIVNMCSIRQSAVNRVHGLAPKFKRIKAKKILVGCFLEKDKKNFEKNFDIIVRTNDLPRFLKNEKIFLDIKLKTSNPPIGYIPIMTGCNNFCSYCVVPYVRGREYSRPMEEILFEAENFIKAGYKEIWLLGQNVNSYLDYKKRNFSKLLKKISKIKGDFWIRFTSSHPKDFTKELILTMNSSKKITKYLNLPLQSGNDEILKKMNRPYNFKEYKKTIKDVRKEMKDISITTDLIVGFPGETKKQFEDSIKAFKDLKFEMAYVSRYSERPETKASKLKDNISIIEKKKREEVLNNIIKENSLKRNKTYVEKIVRVLISSEKKGFYSGKTEHYKSVRISSNKKNLIGNFVKVKIINALPWGLEGKII